MQYFLERIIFLVASFLAVAIVLSLHEFAHAFVAYRCGDPTPKMNGRLTVNPLAHFDILGLLMFTFAGFGWAKPVPINPYNFRHYRRGLTLTAVAGVVMNYLTVLVWCPLYMLALRYSTNIEGLDYFLRSFTGCLYAYSLSFCVFNLIPLPPLDGWRVVEALNRRRGKVFQFFRRYGNIILLVLIGYHFLVSVLASAGFSAVASALGYADVLGWIMEVVTGWIGWPIYTLWGLIL